MVFGKTIVNDKIYKKLCLKHFVGVPKYISIGKAIGHSRTYLASCGAYSTTSIFSVFKLFFSYLKINKFNYRVCVKNSAYSFFYYGFYNSRHDHFKVVDNFSNAFSGMMDSYCFINSNRYYSPFAFFVKVPLYFIWLTSLLWSRYSFKTIYIVMDYLNQFYDFKRTLRTINVKKYSFLVTYYDAAFDQNIVCQYFKYHGKTTMTMQHGMMRPNNNPNFSLMEEIPFRYSLSDYFIVWSRMSRDFALESKYMKNKVVALGIPRYIKYKHKSMIKTNFRFFFGVVLSGYDSENIEMLTIANRFAKENGVRYLIRHSPYTRKNIYDGYIDTELREEIDSFVPIEEYLNMVGFSIVGSTSLFVDFVFLKHKTYLYSGDPHFIYYTMAGISFDDYNSFVLNINNKDLFCDYEYISGPSNIYESYKEFFIKFK